MTPPTPPPRRNLPSGGAAVSITPATPAHGDSSSATTQSPTPSPSPSLASSSVGGARYYAYASRGCCIDFVGWRQPNGMLIVRKKKHQI